MGKIIIFMIMIIACVSVVPIIEILIEKLKPKNESIVYTFSQELFDAEYNDKKEKDYFENRFKVDSCRY